MVKTGDDLKQGNYALIFRTIRDAIDQQPCKHFQERENRMCCVSLRSNFPRTQLWPYLNASRCYYF